jgi:hypothetical protein
MFLLCEDRWSAASIPHTENLYRSWPKERRPQSPGSNHGSLVIGHLLTASEIGPITGKEERVSASPNLPTERPVG